MAQVLLVDPDEGLREALRGALEDDGHTVVDAAEGRAAAQQLRLTGTAMVILFDYTRVHAGGADLVHALAADPVLTGQHTPTSSPLRTLCLSLPPSETSSSGSRCQCWRRPSI
jgi:CheY-like chemotaxis protein